MGGSHESFYLDFHFYNDLAQEQAVSAKPAANPTLRALYQNLIIHQSLCMLDGEDQGCEKVQEVTTEVTMPNWSKVG